jgi:hypothetical protein
LKRQVTVSALRCLRRLSLQSRISAASSGLMMIRASSMPRCSATYPRPTGSGSLRKLIRTLSWFRRPHTLVWQRENSKQLAALFGTGDSHCSTRSRRLSADRTLASGSGGLSGVGWWAYRIASQFQTADRRVTSSPSMSASEREGSPRLATPSPPATYTSFQTITVDRLGFVIHQSESSAQMRSATPLDSSRQVKYAGRYFRHDRGEKFTMRSATSRVTTTVIGKSVSRLDHDFVVSCALSSSDALI